MTTRKTNRNRLKRLFAPTAGLYRYVFAALAGAAIFLIGFGISFQTLLLPVFQSVAEKWNSMIGGVVAEDSTDFTNHLLGLIFLMLGIYLVFWSIRSFIRRMAESLNPEAKRGVIDVYAKKEMLARGPKIVVLGGGTGLSTLLRGLKEYSSNITAIVTVTDDGGSSGRLVNDMGIIPPGDMRNCLVALADAERRMTDLFQHRFTQASGPLSGHSIGNLMIAGFFEQTKDVDKALQMASDVLAIRGRVIPSTRDKVQLKALMEDGSEIVGETALVASDLKVRRIFLEPEEIAPHDEAVKAILDADLVCIGPGSVYTSVIPNLLIPGIGEALSESKAAKAYICNVMTQRGESDAFTAAEHMVSIEANVNHRICDYVLVNTSAPGPDSLQRYREGGQDVVEPDVDRIRHMGYKPVTGDFMSETDYVRHDPARLAERLINLLYQ